VSTTDADVEQGITEQDGMGTFTDYGDHVFADIGEQRAEDSEVQEDAWAYPDGALDDAEAEVAAEAADAPKKSGRARTAKK